MFDIGFIELLICGIIALLILGPERLPTAARAAGRWVGNAKRMVNQFSGELDRQLKADELREELRKAGDIGLDDVQKTVKDALAEAEKHEHRVLSEKPSTQPTSESAKTQQNDQAGSAQDADELPENPPENSTDKRS